MHLFGVAAGGADANDIFNSEKVEELIGIYADRRDTHAARHDGNGSTLVFSGIALYTADIVYEPRSLKKILRNEFRAKRVARHENGGSEILGCRIYMRGRVICHIVLLLISDRFRRHFLYYFYYSARAETRCAESEEFFCILKR